MLRIFGAVAITGLYLEESYRNRNRMKCLESDFFTIVNLECPIHVEGSENEYKNAVHTSSLEAAKVVLDSLNVKCVSLANNHIYDCKLPGLRATIEMLSSSGILFTGAGWQKDHLKPVVFEDGGVRYAFLSYVDIKTNPKTEFFSEVMINYLDKGEILKDVMGIKGCVDKVIVSLHWGEDYSRYPTTDQMNIARDLISGGVDFIMGHHAHVVQPYESIHDGYIFYGLGSLTFGDHRKETGELKSLYRKSKIGLGVLWDGKTNRLSFISTKELKGNYLKIIERNYIDWNKKYWRYIFYMNKYKLMRFLIRFKERFIDRVYEYFFGYYTQFFYRLISVNNLPKIGRLFRDIIRK